MAFCLSRAVVGGTTCHSPCEGVAPQFVKAIEYFARYDTAARCDVRGYILRPVAAARASGS